MMGRPSFSGLEEVCSANRLINLPLFSPSRGDETDKDNRAETGMVEKLLVCLLFVITKAWEFTPQLAQR